MLYVAGEILLWMALAFVLGVLVGWFVWGVRSRAAGKAKGAGKPAEAARGTAVTSLSSTGDIESVTVRPAAKAAPTEAVVVAAAAASAAPVTPPAGTPIVLPPAEPPLDDTTAGDTTAEVEVVPPAAADASASAELASLVTDEGPRWAPDSAAGTGEDVGGLDERVAALEDEVAAAPTADAANEAAARLAAAEDAATAQDVAEARAASEALGPDMAAGAAVLGRKVATDDLKVVEGIGPRIEEVLKESGINTWSDLAAAAPDRLRTILDLAGDQFRVHDPGTWPRQAGLAAEGRWDDLVELQDELTGGRPS